MPNINVFKKIFNEVYFPYLYSQQRDQHFFGGSSGGKSYFLLGQRVIIDLLHGGRNYLICRNTANTIRESVWNEVVKGISNFNINQLFKISKSEFTITCSNGYQVLFRGLDDVQKIKSITPQKGVITDIAIEEATETHYEDVKELRKRLRGPTPMVVIKGRRRKIHKRMVYLYNPMFRSHWLYRVFFEPIGWTDDQRIYKDEKLLILRTTHEDNRFLEREDREDLENESDPYYKMVYTDGIFGILGHTVFNNWSIADLFYRYKSTENLYIGLDFGFTNDVTALIICGVHWGKKELYILDEPIYQTNLTNDQIAKIAKPFVRNQLVICDSAEPKSIQELKNNGINAIGAYKGKGSVNYGIQYLKQFKIIINKTCQNTINEFQLYHYFKNKDGVVINEPVDRDNHALDAIRYAFSKYITKRKKVKKDKKKITLEDMGVVLP